MPERQRFFEIDIARGIAIAMMVAFHTLFDLWYFGIYPVDVAHGFWRYFAFSTATLFLLIVGISFTISYSRAEKALSGFRLYRRFLYRGAGIFALGILVTAATWIYLGEGFIVFGILHLIGVSVLLAPFFYRFGKYNFVIGGAVILAGFLIAGIAGPVWLLPLGFHPAAWWSVDYEPLLPWFGVVLIGLGLGSVLYPEGRRRIPLPELPARWRPVLTFPGRHSLVIYLVHQPVIILILHFATGAVPL
ncbi:MAG TPA: heparan-alpha-glucosaminide N-acetyltransferase [Methanoregula sp.]|nr:heparan-alpha-glucosaminide N-acetyltransferase [Methanoregula sp.]